MFKALFLLQTELPNEYKFNININENFSIEFYYNSQKIDFENLHIFIKNEYKNQLKENEKIKKDKIEIEEQLEKIKEESKKLDLEYIIKQKQIATFLQYKKTFFGKFKYYIKRKQFLKKDNDNLDVKLNRKILKIDKILDTDSNQENKQYYTIEELIVISKQKQEQLNILKNLKLDIQAANTRNINIENKIKNAKLYIEEIDKHTKSIFDFWKFTNKDKIEELPEPENNIKVKITKTFKVEQDFEEFSKQLDNKQREVLSKEETDSIFLLTTDLIDDINSALQKKEIQPIRIEQLKQESIENKKITERENFDIFGSLIQNKNKVNILANKKHREILKEKYSILKIQDLQSEKEYIKFLEDSIKNIDKGLEKIKTSIEIPIYKLTKKDEKLNQEFEIFHLNPKNLINQINKLPGKELILHKIILKENTPILGLTNIIYYDNTNQTLPIGMDLSDQIIIKKSLLEIKNIGKNEFNIISKQNNDIYSLNIEIKQIKVLEYEAKYKTTKHIKFLQNNKKNLKK